MYNINRVAVKCADAIDEYCKKNGFSDSRIITKWSTIIGKDMSDLIYPVKIMTTKKNNSLVKILVLHSNDHGFVSNFVMIKDIIMKKITQYMGIKYINDIILK